MNNLQRLHGIVETHQCDRLCFGRQRVLVDAQTARALVAVYRALETEGKRKFEQMVEASVENLAKLMDFAWSKARFA